MTNSIKSLVVSFAFVGSILGFASVASADPDPCAAYPTCVAEGKGGCEDKAKACLDKKDADLKMCTDDVDAMSKADPKCEAVYKERHKDDDKKVPVKAAPLVCDAPASKKAKGVGCECPAGMFLTIVAGKPGHLSCASTQDPAEVKKIATDLAKLGKAKLTNTERGELSAYEGMLSKLYKLDAATGNSEMPNYVAAYELLMKLVQELYGPDMKSGWIGKTEQRLAAIEQCLATGECAAFPWISGVANWQSKLQACMSGGDCSAFPEFDRVRREARSKVFVRPTIGGEFIFRKGGDKAYALETGAGIYGPVTDSVDWFVRGSIGLGHSDGLGSIGVARAGTGFAFKVTDAFSVDPELYFRFLGRFDSLGANDGSTLVKGGYGGHAGGLAVNLHGRITDVFGIGGFLGAEMQKNEWAACTTSKACYRSDSGLGGAFGLYATFSFGAPSLR